MNWDVIQGQWKEFSGQFKAKWGDFTDNELMEAEGNRDRLAGMLQKKYGWAKEEAEQRLDEWANAVDNAAAR